MYDSGLIDNSMKKVKCNFLIENNAAVAKNRFDRIKSATKTIDEMSKQNV
jgi:phosphoglycerate-specific signal transduction histidine kinase